MTKSQPTEEQVWAVVAAFHEQEIPRLGESWAPLARAAWAVIAPMVLEEAARVCDDIAARTGSLGAEEAAERIRAMKGGG